MSSIGTFWLLSLVFSRPCFRAHLLVCEEGLNTTLLNDFLLGRDMEPNLGLPKLIVKSLHGLLLEM